MGFEVFLKMHAFKLWWWKRLLRIPWTAKRSDQSILKEINPEYSLEGLMLKLKLHYPLATWWEEPFVWKRPWYWESMRAGAGGDRRWDGWMASLIQWMWELDRKVWVLKNWCFQTVVLEKILESPLDSKEIKPVNPKGNQSCIFIGRTDAKAEASIFWPPDVKRQLNGKDPNAGKEWGQEEKGVTEDEMVEWHHRVNGHEFEETPRGGERQGSLACSNSHVTKSWTWLSDWTTTIIQQVF